MAKVNDILAFVETLAPRYMKMEWDNVGLLCGRGGKEVRKVMVALDPFYSVCCEAAAWGADVLVTHHPLIFRPAASVTDLDPVGRSILCLAENGIAAINAHTNLDQVCGGVNDCLAAKLGLTDTEVVAPEGEDENGKPWGLLRAGYVQAQSAAEFAAFVKERLSCSGVRFVDGGKPVQRVAVGGGACADELRAVLRAGCDTLVTADAKYNQFQTALDCGVTLIDAGHFETENPVTAYLAEQIAAAFPEIEVMISKTHRDPVEFI